jgi:hypothetical protein
MQKNSADQASKTLVIGGSVGALVLLAILVAVAIWAYVRAKAEKTGNSPDDEGEMTMPELVMTEFSEAELSQMTFMNPVDDDQDGLPFNLFAASADET